MSTWTAERARVASLSRSRTRNDPELLAARRNLAAARLADRIEEYVAGIVAAAPDLTPAQRDKLAMLLRGGQVA